MLDFQFLKKELEINNFNDTFEVKEKFLKYMKKNHPDINKNINLEKVQKITFLYEQYKKIYCSNKNSHSFNDTTNNTTNNNKEKINIMINLNIIDLITKKDFYIIINNKKYFISLKDIDLDKLEGKITFNNIIINYKVKKHKNLNIDKKSGRFIYTIKIPFNLYILKEPIIIYLGKYKFKINIPENFNLNSLIELKNNKLNKNIYLKIDIEFPEKTQLNNKQIHFLKKFYNIK